MNTKRFMKHFCRLCLSLLVLGLPKLAETTDAVALVIGNGAYDQSALRNPVNDATAIAASLERIGYEVILETDRTQRNLNEALLRFGSALREGGSAIFYFAGHGIQVNGNNFLLPVDADLANPMGVIDDSVQVGKVLELMSEAKTKLNLIVLDCCRDNPFRTRGIEGVGLAPQLGPPNTMIAFSTAPGSVALDGDADHSPYTTSLLNHLENPGLTITEVFRSVARDVSEETDQQQRPWKSDDFAEDFHLVLKKRDQARRETSPDGAILITFSPGRGSERKYQQKLEVSGLGSTPDGIEFPLFLSISQTIRLGVLDVNPLTGLREFKATASEIGIRIEATVRGQVQQFEWNSKAGPMSAFIQQYLTPSGVAMVDRILKEPYRFQVNQVGKIAGDGLGLDEVFADCSSGLNVSTEQLRAHSIANGSANRYGPHVIFSGAELYPGRAIKIGEKWTDREGTELKLVSAENGICRIAATNTAFQNPKIALSAVSGVVEIELETGLLHRMSLRGRSDFGGEMKNGHFALSVETVE